MQRVRIGLTGLGLVFLLVLLGAVIRSASDSEPTSVNVIGQAGAPESIINEQQAESADPLAQLGVAPGNADVQNTATTGSPKK